MNKEMLSIQWQSPGSGSRWPGMLTGQSVTGVAWQEGCGGMWGLLVWGPAARGHVGRRLGGASKGPLGR